MIKLELITDWKQAWKFASIQWNSIGLVLMIGVEFSNQFLMNLPPAIQQKIPHVSTLALVLFVLGLLGRILQLKEKQQDG